MTLRKLRLFYTFPWSPAQFYEMPFYWWILWPMTVLVGLYYFFKMFSPSRSLLHFVIVLYTFSIVITHVEDEYRIPILPLIFIFVSVALVGVLQQLYAISLKISNTVVEWQIKKPAIVLAWSLLVMVIFALQIPSPQISYRVDSVESDAVHGGVIVGQKFEVECPNLYRIRVKMWSPNPAHSLIFHLREGSVEGPDLYTQVINTASLNSFDYHTITFPEIADSAGKQYVFYFDTANLKSAEEGIFFAGGRDPFAESLNRIDPVKRINGGAFVSLGDLDGNLAFTALCQAGPIELIETAINQLANNISASPVVKPLLVGIIVTHVLALLSSASFIFYKYKLKRRQSRWQIPV